jgi:hypothetical protein
MPLPPDERLFFAATDVREARTESGILLAQTEPFFANHFLHLILALGLGDAKTMADIAKFHAELPLLNDDPERRRGYLLLEADFRQAQDDTAREAEARLLAGETYVEEAEDNPRRNPPSYLAASSSLAKGGSKLSAKRLLPRQGSSS